MWNNLFFAMFRAMVVSLIVIMQVSAQAYPPGLVANYVFDSPGSKQLTSTAGGPLLTFHGGMDSDAPNRWGTAVIDGREVNTLRFEGDGYVSGPAEGLPAGAAPRSLAGWFKPRTSGNGPFGWGNSFCNNAYYIWISGGHTANLDQWCQTEGVNPVIAHTENRWYHVLLTYDGTQNAAYVDGHLVRAGTPDEPPNTQTTSPAIMVIGGNPGKSGDFFGEVAEVSVYNRALTSEEIVQLWIAGPQPPPKDNLETPFVFRDDADQRAICNQIATEAACNDDRLCSWNVFQATCNDHGYQPLFKGCNQCNYIKPVAWDDGMHLGSCPDPYQQDGWQMVFEVEDGDGDDVPNDWNSVLNGLGTGGGFETDTAYFWGVNKLNAIDYTQIQICGGYRASTDGCPRVKCNNIDSSMLGDFPDHVNNAGFTNPLSKVIACFAGADCATFLTVDVTEWRFPIGYADDPAPMETYGEAETGELVWACGATTGAVYGYPHYTGWHFWGTGWQAAFQNTGTDELSMHNGVCNSAQADDGLLNYMNLVQIRVKTA